MKRHPRDVELLGALAAMPLLDRLELAAISGRSAAAVYERVDRLLEGELVEAVGHASDLIAPTYRFCLSARGLRRLAFERREPLFDLLRRAPVSEQWRRIIFERLDAVAVIYRLTASASEFAFPLVLRWHRAGPLDAVLALADGRRIAIVRQGRTADRTAFSKRIRRLRATQGVGAVLLISPDETRLRHARRLVSGPPAISFLALEHDVALSDGHAPIWRGPSGTGRLSLRQALALAAPAAGTPSEPALARMRMPVALDAELGSRLWQAPAALTAAEKRTLDLIGDWPWIRPRHLAGLLGVGRRRLSAVLRRLDQLRLISRLVQAGHPRLILSERGLAYLARRDRSSVGNARKRWSAAPREAGAPLAWRNLRGIRSRQLLRHLAHTESVHSFHAQLAAQARPAQTRLVQLDPPHRASRYFRHRQRLGSIHPDSYLLLRTAERERGLFLEWERRAVRPVTMLARLAPYLRYFASGRPLEDHGLLPLVLVVFEQEAAADLFLRVADQAMAPTALQLPLFVSHVGAIVDQGPLGPAWRSVERRGPVSLF